MEKLAQDGVGYCSRDFDNRVRSQNSVCEKNCLPQVGLVCKMGCGSVDNIRRTQRSPIGAMFLTNIMVNQQLVRCVIYKNESSYVTIQLPPQKETHQLLLRFSEMGLTKTELKVVEDRLLGLSNRQIAEKLFVSMSTLKTHFSNIYRKLPDSDRRLLQANSAATNNLGGSDREFPDSKPGQFGAP